MIKTVEFGSLFEFIRNGMNVRQDKSGEGVPITRIETISDAVIDSTRVGYADLKEADCSSWLLENGDILFSHINSVDHIGKCAIYEGVPGKLVHGMNLLCLRPDKAKLTPQFAKYLIRSLPFRSRLSSFVNKAVNQASVSIGNLKTIPVEVPLLEEQLRISSILDKADAIRRKRQESIRLSEEFLRSTFLEMFGDIPAKKSKYVFGTIRGLVSAQSGKSSGPVLSQDETGIPVYGGNGINGCATKPLFLEPVIVVGRVGQQCGIIHITEGPAWVTDNAIVVKVTDFSKLHPIYVAEALQRSPLRSTVENLDLPFINQSMILDYPIPMPPLNKQIEYVKIKESVIRNRLNLRNGGTTADQLFNSLTHLAFRGEL